MKNDIKDHVIIEHFHSDGGPLLKSQIGWQKHHSADAFSDDPEKIFRYYFDETGLDITFFWLEDMHEYGINQSDYDEIRFVKFAEEPNWEKLPLTFKYDEDYDRGEMIGTFQDNTKVYTEARINGKGLPDVLANSVIFGLN